MGYTRGIKWTDDLIRMKIEKVMKVLNIERMPSNSEIQKVTNSSSLQNAIRRRGGLYRWAKLMNLEIKDSETKTGKGYEKYATEILINKGYEVKRMSVKYPFDLLVNNNIKIDVKAGRLHTWSCGTFYTIGIEKKYATCDLYMIFALTKDAIDKFLIIPSNKLKLTTLNIGHKSIYDKYINRWDYIEKYDNFYKTIN